MPLLLKIMVGTFNALVNSIDFNVLNFLMQVIVLFLI